MRTDRVRVLIVDDSATMRSLIASVLGSNPEIEVIGSAADALQARQAIKQLNPDVITLDVEMPNMDGLEFLEKIMRLRPMPVVMVSTLTSKGADATLAALELGAFDCVGKPAPDDARPFPNLAEVVRQAGRSKRSWGAERQPAQRNDEVDRTLAGYRPGHGVVAIGASTGGVEALITVLSGYPENCPPTLITQHMPEAFTSSFAARLDRVCPARVSEASDGAPILPGQVYLAPGGATHLEVAGGMARRCRLRSMDPVNGHRPSVDVLFHSIAATCGRRAVGAILTGMGRDGAAGLLAMRQAGAMTIGQDPRSCVVYGMPRVAHELGAVATQLPLRRISEAILEMTASRLESTT